MKYSFAGAKAKTANLDNLANAEARIANGEDAEVVHFDSGRAEMAEQASKDGKRVTLFDDSNYAYLHNENPTNVYRNPDGSDPLSPQYQIDSKKSVYASVVANNGHIIATNNMNPELLYWVTRNHPSEVYGFKHFSQWSPDTEAKAYISPFRPEYLALIGKGVKQNVEYRKTQGRGRGLQQYHVAGEGVQDTGARNRDTGGVGLLPELSNGREAGREGANDEISNSSRGRSNSEAGGSGVKFSRNNSQGITPTAQPQQDSQQKTTTDTLTKQQATDIISQDDDGKRLLARGKVKVLGSMDEAPENIQDQITLSDDNGNIQGFFDPATDTTYLVADALTADSIQGVLVHEVGVHAWWAKANSDNKAALEKRAMQLLNQGKRFGNEKIKAFYAAVEQRMMDAGVQGNAEEAVAYIVEEAINQAGANKSKLSDSRIIDWVAKNISQSLANFLSDFISSVRASMHRIGWLKTANLTGADLVAIAKRNMREVATSKGVENTQINVSDYAGVLASMASNKPTQAEIAQAQRDLDIQLAIADKLEAEYGYLTAPNGEKSNPNRLQWAQVRTPQFKEFYGDWEKNGKQLEVYRGSEQGKDWRGIIGGSEAIATANGKATGGIGSRNDGNGAGFTDGNGEPVVFYHGTSDDVISFDTNHKNRKDKGWLGN